MDGRLFPLELQEIIKDVVKPNYIVNISYEFANKDPEISGGRSTNRKVELTIKWTLAEVIPGKTSSMESLFENTFTAGLH